MRKITTVLLLTVGFLSGNRLTAQSKTGCISFNELLNAMPEFKILSRLQGFEQQASVLLDQKKQLLLMPIQTKASAAIEAVSKENGYAFILEKDVLHVYPPTEDILPLVKRRLGINTDRIGQH